MRKPGLAKYAAYRGPHPSQTEEHRAFWLAELERETGYLAEARAQWNARLVRLAQGRIKAAKAELAQCHQI